VTDPKKAAGALNWGVAEMTRRYQMFAEVGVRNLAGYNAKAESLREAGLSDAPKKMPQIVIIVDELADLMMVSGNEVEDAICRLAQLARACGIHLVIATQRPSVDVITGLIKANIPSRIAFSVSSGTDSRTILDMNGAEKLLGNGDMLFAPQTYKKPVRVQGAFVSDEEIQEVVEAIRVDTESPAGSETMKKRMAEVQKAASSILSSSGGGDDVDELFAEAGRFIIQKDKASIGMLQRWFKIGFNRAARIMDQLSDAGVVGPDEGTKPRKVIMSAEQFENYLEEN
jgi:S-DNA-T family DNA segregation ATPase FtsK/SpoIIIE